MLEIIKNMFRRKLRTTLTIFGITIGVFALVVMGSMAEKMTILVEGGTRYYSDKVNITEGANIAGFALSPISIDKVVDVEKVEGIKVASAEVYLTLEEDIGGVNFGPPALVVGTDMQGDEYEKFKITYKKGRKLTNEDRGKATVGSDLVDKLDAKIGEKITIRDRKFEVVGIVEKTLTVPDTTVVVPLADIQEIYHKTLPEVFKNQTKPEKLASGIIGYVEDGYDPNEVANAVQEEVENIKAVGPKAFEEQIASQVGIFTTIIFGIALISLLVGGLSVINTMVMSISERTREIGVKKATGAKMKDVLFEYLTEAGFIGLLGGLVGLVLGALFVYLVNLNTQTSGERLFLLTPRLAIGSVIFAIVLGVISGIYPAVHAAKVNIVKALREE